MYEKYNHRKFIPPDPLQFVYKYRKNSDREIIAFFSAALAYGRVEQIEKSLIKLFSNMGKSPFDFVINFKTSDAKNFDNFKHRFNSSQDIVDIIWIFKKVLNKHGSLYNLFKKHYDPSNENILPALESFINDLRYLHNDQISNGLNYLLCKPSSGSACKRLNMFLRWMVRNDDVDPGTWKGIDPAKLIIPVDVHIGRLTQFLGMHSKKNMNLTTAIEITKAFVRFTPDDPVKYDFALSRIGILENCNGVFGDKCTGCVIFDHCRKR